LCLRRASRVADTLASFIHCDLYPLWAFRKPFVEERFQFLLVIELRSDHLQYLSDDLYGSVLQTSQFPNLSIQGFEGWSACRERRLTFGARCFVSRSPHPIPVPISSTPQPIILRPMLAWHHPSQEPIDGTAKTRQRPALVASVTWSLFFARVSICSVKMHGFFRTDIR